MQPFDYSLLLRISGQFSYFSLISFRHFFVIFRYLFISGGDSYFFTIFWRFCFDKFFYNLIFSGDWILFMCSWRFIVFLVSSFVLFHDMQAPLFSWKIKIIRIVNYMYTYIPKDKIIYTATGRPTFRPIHFGPTCFRPILT